MGPGQIRGANIKVLIALPSYDPLTYRVDIILCSHPLSLIYILFFHEWALTWITTEKPIFAFATNSALSQRHWDFQRPDKIYHAIVTLQQRWTGSLFESDSTTSGKLGIVFWAKSTKYWNWQGNLRCFSVKIVDILKWLQIQISKEILLWKYSSKQLTKNQKDTQWM